MHYQTNYRDPVKDNMTVSFESYSIESLVECLRRMLFVEQDVPWDAPSSKFIAFEWNLALHYNV